MRFDGPLFLHLAYNNHTMPLQADRAVWKLSSSVAATWQHLEDTLLFVAGVLIPKLGMIFPLSFTDCPMPQTKGYLQTHKTSNIALQCALKSLNAFLPLIAKCSMAIAHATNDSSPTMSTPWWIEYLKTNHNLHPEMLESLRQYCVGNLSHPRVGVIVHVATCQYFNLIKTMLRVEIPIWFYWGSCKSRPPKAGFKWVDSLCPHLTRFQHYLCLMLHPPTLLACHRNPSPSPVSQRLNPRVDKSQETHGSSLSRTGFPT